MTSMISVHPSTASGLSARQRSFLSDVAIGLSRSRKTLPCRYFYDRHGSRLFDRICELDEYYPTRTELSIMRRFCSQMGERLGERVMLIELGSGSSVKTRLLLDALVNPVAYVPVDVSGEHLRFTASQLAAEHPEIAVLPVEADFTTPFDLPTPSRDETHDAVYFPGSTIGNFTRPQAGRLMQRIAALCGENGGLLIGVDLHKDTTIVEAAYNDQEGVTAAWRFIHTLWKFMPTPTTRRAMS